jgi:nucleotide-binding universal stress UspA family protein
LFPLDGSERAEVALGWAHVLPAGRIRLLHVCPGENPDSQAAARYLEEVVARSGLAESEVETRIAHGGPAEAIVADAVDTDLIVMSTQGAGGGGRLLFGSVADRVARHAPAPTLLLRGGNHPVTSDPVRRIVIPLDGSPGAERALPLATVLARMLSVPVHLVTASDRDVRDTKSDSEQSGRGLSTVTIAASAGLAGDYLETAAASLRALDIATSTEIRSGPAATEVMAALAPGDLLVITTHGQGAARRWQIGNVAEKLLRQAGAPVALVRADLP